MTYVLEGGFYFRKYRILRVWLTLCSEQHFYSMIPTTPISATGMEETCTYEIRRGSPEGPQLRFATVGEKAYHIWKCSQAASKSMSFGKQPTGNEV